MLTTHSKSLQRTTITSNSFIFFIFLNLFNQKKIILQESPLFCHKQLLNISLHDNDINQLMPTYTSESLVTATRIWIHGLQLKFK